MHYMKEESSASSSFEVTINVNIVMHWPSHAEERFRAESRDMSQADRGFARHCGYVFASLSTIGRGAEGGWASEHAGTEAEYRAVDPQNAELSNFL